MRAADYRERLTPAPGPEPVRQLAGSSDSVGDTGEIEGGQGQVTIEGATETSSAVQTAAKKQFYGNTELDPLKAKLDFATIVDEVVQQFTAKLGVEVSISVEIQASSKEGFDESLQRAVKENCNVLRFDSSEFE